MNIQPTIIGLALCVASIQCNSQTYTKDEIQALAENHALSIYPKQSDETVQANASPIDPRLEIKDCLSELSAEIPNFNPYSQNMTVRVRCYDDAGWAMYIPVQVKVLTPVVVASEYIEVGQTLSKNDLKTILIEKNRSRNGFIDTEQNIVGSKAKRQIKSGEAILAKNICFVCEGELVTIEASTASLTVKAVGIALSDGGFGETVSVRNKNSNRTVQGRVSSVGEIKILL